MPSNSFAAIPEELRAYKQWVLWKFKNVGSKKLSKIPYSYNGMQASVTNPNDWCSFSDIVHHYSSGEYDGIGFVFTEFDPYAFIDLDDTEGNKEDFERQIKILETFDSYAEFSPSGNGLHIIVKGNIPQGRKRSHVEVYSSGRYATMTGRIYQQIKPIVDKHDLLNQLYTQMGGAPKTYNGHDGNSPQTEDDEQIIEIASNASNGAKFISLHNGEWEGLYPTQSEADLAYVDIIAFYTQNAIQIERIFRNSKLMRDKVNKNKDYLPNAIKKSFDRLLPKIDFDGFRIALEEKLAQQQLALPLNDAASSNGKTTPFDGGNLGSNPSAVANTEASPSGLRPTAHNSVTVGSNPTASTILPPPGLVGEIAQFIYQAAPRPVPEIAIAGAMGFMAGICGRAYNVSGTGLNQYILLLASTGTGKESMASGIDKIINEVQLSVPVASEFIGPSEIASGQALIKYLGNKSQCFVSILGEFGLRLRSMSSDRANGAEIALRRMLLDLYNKSGYGQVARPSIYADVEKNTNLIMAPAFSILGESTPERFYDILNEEMISEGLLPRFMLIEYSGPRPALNENSIGVKPPDWLIKKIATLMANVKTTMAANKIINVDASKEAFDLLKDFDRLADNKINSTNREIVRQLWNRAHIKVLKIAALIAVGVHPFNPIINKDEVKWAINMVENDIKSLSEKFDKGEVGKTTSELKQLSEVKRIIKEFVTMKPEKIKSYQIAENLYYKKYIPMSFIQRRLLNNKSFKDDKIGPSNAITKMMRLLIDTDYISEVSRKEANEAGTRQKLYMITNMSLLDD